MNEVGDKCINVSYNSASMTKRTLLDIMRYIAYKKQQEQFKVKHGYQKLKDLNKKNVELDSIGLDKADYKNIKKDLKRMGVDFAIHKNKKKNKIDIYFASRDIKQISNVLKKYTEQKLDHKEKTKKTKKNKNNTKDEIKVDSKGKEYKEITINKKLVYNTNEENHFTKIPYQKEYINYDTNDTEWIDDGKTLYVKIDPNKEYSIYDKDKNKIKTIKGHQIHEYYDDAKERSINAKMKKAKTKAKNYNKNRQAKSKKRSKQKEMSR